MGIDPFGHTRVSEARDVVPPDEMVYGWMTHVYPYAPTLADTF
jgi:hypothetical protein